MNFGPTNRSGAQLELPYFLARHAAIGFAIATFFVAALIVADVGRLGTLVVGSDVGALALALLTFFTGLTFGSVQMGIAIMLLGQDGHDSKKVMSRQNHPQ